MWTVVTSAAPWQQQAGGSSNVVSALSSLNVAPNAKGKENLQKNTRGDIWAGLGGAPRRFLYVESVNFLNKKKKSPIFWQIIASFGNISSSRVSTMHMLMRGKTNYSPIGEAFRQKDTLQKEACENWPRLDFKTLRHRAAIPEAALTVVSRFVRLTMPLSEYCRGNAVK